MRRALLAAQLLFAGLCAAGAIAIFWFAPNPVPDRFPGERLVLGQVVSTDCPNHGHVAFAYQAEGRTYRRSDLSPLDKPDCFAIRRGEPVKVWIENGDPARGSLRDLQPPRPQAHAVARAAAAALLFFALLVAWQVVMSPVGLNNMRLGARLFWGERGGA
jgi:hypothetical protein